MCGYILLGCLHASSAFTPGWLCATSLSNKIIILLWPCQRCCVCPDTLVASSLALSRFHCCMCVYVFRSRCTFAANRSGQQKCCTAVLSSGRKIKANSNVLSPYLLQLDKHLLIHPGQAEGQRGGRGVPERLSCRCQAHMPSRGLVPLKSCMFCWAGSLGTKAVDWWCKGPFTRQKYYQNCGH